MLASYLADLTYFEEEYRREQEEKRFHLAMYRRLRMAANTVVNFVASFFE